MSGEDPELGGIDMSALVFTTKAPRTHRTQDSVGFWRGLAILALVLIVFWISIISVTLVRGNTPVTDLAPQALMLLSMVFLLPTVVSQWKIARWSRNSEITLNDKGLFFTSGPKTFRWSWQDLSPFEVRTAKPFRSWTGVSHVRIALREAGAIKRFLRSWREPRMIFDTYEPTLEEIATQLNDYRDRALGGASTTGPD